MTLLGGSEPNDQFVEAKIMSGNADADSFSVCSSELSSKDSDGSASCRVVPKSEAASVLAMNDNADTDNRALEPAHEVQQEKKDESIVCEDTMKTEKGPSGTKQALDFDSNSSVERKKLSIDSIDRSSLAMNPAAAEFKSSRSRRVASSTPALNGSSTTTITSPSKDHVMSLPVRGDNDSSKNDSQGNSISLLQFPKLEDKLLSDVDEAVNVFAMMNMAPSIENSPATINTRTPIDGRIRPAGQSTGWHEEEQQDSSNMETFCDLLFDEDLPFGTGSRLQRNSSQSSNMSSQGYISSHQLDQMTSSGALSGPRDYPSFNYPSSMDYGSPPSAGNSNESLGIVGAQRFRGHSDPTLQKLDPAFSLSQYPMPSSPPLCYGYEGPGSTGGSSTSSGGNGTSRRGPSGPRQPGEGTEDLDQDILSVEPCRGGRRMRITLLAAGFVIGQSGISIRAISQFTGANIQSWTENCGMNGALRSTRVFQLQGTTKACDAAEIIIRDAVDRYKTLCEGKSRGEYVQRVQRIHGVEFSYQPPPRSAAPMAAALGNARSQQQLLPQQQQQVQQQQVQQQHKPSPINGNMSPSQQIPSVTQLSSIQQITPPSSGSNSLVWDDSSPESNSGTSPQLQNRVGVSRRRGGRRVRTLVRQDGLVDLTKGELQQDFQRINAIYQSPTNLTTSSSSMNLQLTPASTFPLPQDSDLMSQQQQQTHASQLASRIHFGVDNNSNAGGMQNQNYLLNGAPTTAQNEGQSFQSTAKAEDHGHSYVSTQNATDSPVDQGLLPLPQELLDAPFTKSMGLGNPWSSIVSSTVASSQDSLSTGTDSETKFSVQETQRRSDPWTQQWLGNSYHTVGSSNF